MVTLTAMSPLTRDQLRARVRVLTGIRSTSTVPDAEIDQRLDEAYAEVNQLAEWGPTALESETSLVAGSAVATIPPLEGDGTLPLDVWVSDGSTAATLYYVPSNEFSVLPEVEGRQPSRYTIDYEGGNTIVRVWPTPPDGWTLYTRYEGAGTFAGGTDTPWFAPEFHPLLAYAVAVRLLTESGDTGPRVPAYQQELSSLLARMRSRYLAPEDRGPIRIGRPADGVRRFGRIGRR